MAVRFKRSYHDRKETKARRRKTVIRVLIIFISFQILFSFFISTIKMNSQSMEPGIKKGSHLVFSPITYGFNANSLDFRLPQLRTPERGDLVIFTPPYIETISGAFSILSGFVKFISFGRIDLLAITNQQWDQRYLLKRVIAVPGDTVKMTEYRALIKPENSSFFLNEFEVIEKDYDINIEALPLGWDGDLPFSGNMEEIILGEDEYFVLGDNRLFSSDSVNWGPLKRENINGMVLLNYWPFKDFSFFP